MEKRPKKCGMKGCNNKPRQHKWREEYWYCKECSERETKRYLTGFLANK